MAAIAAIFILVGVFEWVYLRRDKQKPQTKAWVLGFTFLLMAGMETLFLLQDRWSIGMAVNAVFSPIQKALFAGH